MADRNNVGIMMQFATKVSIFVFAGILVFFVGCERSSNQTVVAGTSLSKQVVVTNYPLFEFTKRILDGSKGNVEVSYIGPEDESDDPRQWSPSTKQIRELQKADLIVVNGPGAVYASWLTFVTVDKSKLCRSADALALEEYIVVKEFQVTHSHGAEGEHSHDWVVPNCWLDPALAKRQAQEIAKQLSSLYPDSESTFASNLTKLESDFDNLISSAESIKQRVSGLDSKTVISSDPRLKFLTRAVGLDDEHLIWFASPDAETARMHLMEMQKKLAGKQPLAILWVGDKNPSAGDHAELVNEMVGDSKHLSAFSLPPSDGDYFSIMKSNLNALEKLVNQ